MTTDTRDTATFNGAAVQRRKFTDRVVVTDYEPRFVAFVAQILGWTANGRARGDDVVFAEFDEAVFVTEANVRLENGAVADFRESSDHAERTDRDVITDFDVLGNHA